MTDLVVQSEVLKAQEALERKARNEWHKKWGFYLNFNKIMIEEALQRGFTEEQFRKIWIKKKDKGNTEPDIWKIKPFTYVPVTSCGYVGWRCDKDYSLEKFGPLYRSPKLSLPYEQPYSCIFLG